MDGRLAKHLPSWKKYGFLISYHTSSEGGKGYGTQSKLVIPPEAIVRICLPDWRDAVV
jgi:hypothetical protein